MLHPAVWCIIQLHQYGYSTVFSLSSIEKNLEQYPVSSDVPVIFLTSKSEQQQSQLNDVKTLLVLDDKLSVEFIQSIETLFVCLKHVEFLYCNANNATNDWCGRTLNSVTTVTFMKDFPNSDALKKILLLFPNLKFINAYSYKNRRHSKLRQDKDFIGIRQQIVKFDGYCYQSKKTSKGKVFC
jgi:hypothetical protein